MLSGVEISNASWAKVRSAPGSRSEKIRGLRPSNLATSVEPTWPMWKMKSLSPASGAAAARTTPNGAHPPWSPGAATR